MKSQQEEFLKEAKERFNEAKIYWQDNHTACRIDYNFFHKEGGQWEESLKRDRKEAKRPCISVHLLLQFIQLIVNQQRQNKFANKLAPVGATDGATVSIMQDIVAYIERRADINTETIQAYEDAVITGMGAVRIHTEYQHYASFDQEIRIEAIREPWNRLYIDPSYAKKIAQDMRWCFILNHIKKKDFIAKYPKAELSSFSFEGDIVVPYELIQVAEYYKIEEKEKILIGLDDGSVHFWEDLNDYQKIYAEPKIVKRQKRKVPKVVYYKITGSDILEEKELSCEQIPIVPVYGASYHNSSRKIYYGIIRHTKDPQRMYNIYNNTILEHVLLSSITPFVAAKGSLDGLEHKWKTAHKYNYGVLEFNPVTNDGIEAGPPTKLPFPQIPPEIPMHLTGVKQDLSSTTGIYSAKLGNTSNETSGRAIAARIGQSDISTFHFLDNFQRSFKEIGRIFLQIIPSIFDTFRIIRIRDVDGREKALMLNATMQDPMAIMEQKKKLIEENAKIQIAEQEIRNSNFQHYDVEITAEVTQQTKKAEQQKILLDFVELLPDHHRIFFSDLIAEGVDVHNREVIVERAKQLPEIQMLMQQQMMHRGASQQHLPEQDKQ